jgi:hypothetical protein
MDNVAQRNIARAGTDPPQPFSPPGGKQLTEHDAAYLEARGVTLEVAKAAGYWTASKPSETPDAFSSYQRRRTPTLIAQHLSPDGVSVGWQKRDRHPGRDRHGDLIKWASPKGARLVLSVHPWTADEATGGTGRLWLPEGLTRLHALTGHGEAAISYAGCYAWKQDGKPLRCFDYVSLSGRLVLDVPDADYRINENVQKALGERVAFLESRGARVLVVSVPPVNGDQHAGLDDYLAAGGDLEALVREARPFVPVDTGRERLKKNERLRVFVAAKMREVEELQAPTGPACNGIKLARWMLENPTPAHGKLKPRGVEIHPSFPQMAEGVRIGSYQTVSKGLDWLEAAGILEIKKAPRGSRLASRYLLLNPWGEGSTKSVNIEGLGGVGTEGQEYRGENNAREESSRSQRDSSLCLHSARGVVKTSDRAEKVPALRNSKLVHTYAMREGRKVVVHSDYFKRYGSRCEEIFRYIVRVGGADEGELLDKYGSELTRPRAFRRRYLKEMLDDGVCVRDGSRILPAVNWPAALERVRARTNEDEDNRCQSEKYAARRRNYRERLAGEKRGEIAESEPTPELAGPEKVREIVEAAEKREHAARVEEQRSKVGMTPEVFLADALRDVSGFGWRELRGLWIAKGGKPEHLRQAVKHPYRFRREGGDGPLYVERIGATPEPEREPAPVAVLREPENLRKPEIESRPEKVDGIHRHGPLCECEWCEAPVQLRYARAQSGT